MKNPTLKQQKTLNKVREVMQDYPAGIPFNELMQKCLLSAVATQHALGILGASESFDGLWRLPHRNDGVNTQDDGTNIQDKELNTQAPHVNYHDNELSSSDNDEATPINPSAEVTNPSAKVINPSAIDTNTDPDAIINEGVKQISILEEAKDAPYEKLIMSKKPRNKPFTPNPIMGYQVQKGKAKIFLDRRATSKTLTLSLDDLKELVNAVEKSERVA